MGDDEYLCHETSKDLLGDIVGKGLIPSVGDIYRGYWLRGRECNELYNLLQPGVFLMRGRTSFHTYYRQPVKLYVKLEGLDMDSLYVDHAFPKEQSVFYTKQIPAEDLFIKKRKEGKTVMVPLMEKVKLC